jgi:hypothetical protein
MNNNNTEKTDDMLENKEGQIFRLDAIDLDSLLSYIEIDSELIMAVKRT